MIKSDIWDQTNLTSNDELCNHHHQQHQAQQIMQLNPKGSMLNQFNQLIRRQTVHTKPQFQLLEGCSTKINHKQLKTKLMSTTHGASISLNSIITMTINKRNYKLE